MPMRTIYVTENDARRLRTLIATLRRMTATEESPITELSAQLDSATIVRSEDIPPDVVTMNSTVHLEDLDTHETLFLTLVFPHRADSEVDRVSILSSIGSALFGRKKGDSLMWDTPEGRRRLRVEEVLYQPEADGQISMDYTK